MVWILRILLIVILIQVFWIILNKKIAREIRKKFYQQDNQAKENFFEKIKDSRIKHVIIVVLVFLFANISGNNIKKSLIISVITYLLILGCKMVKRNSEKKSILQDLLNVTECLRVQISSGISLDIALRNVPKLCKNKEFEAKLTDLYLEYELSKFTVGSSARELQNRFNYSEIKIFVSALNQQSQNTSALEAFDNLIGLLKEKYIEYMEENTKAKSLIMVFGVLIIVFNLAVMSVYPLITEAMEALKVMLG